MLRVISKQDAVACVLNETKHLTGITESLPIAKAYGRVLSENIVAQEDVPSFDRSTVDGYAVIAADTFGAGESLPAELSVIREIHMGEEADFTLKRGTCARIATGGMLPGGADAVVMVEHTQSAGDLCLVFSSVSPGENVTKQGDDVAVGTCVLQQGSLIGAAETGVLSALGIDAVPVFRKPVVGVISTGDELTKGAPGPGQVRDINTSLLSAAATAAGCDVYCYGAVKDDRACIQEAVEACLASSDIVLISGGSSAGTKDMTVDILSTLGKVHFHGIAMKPGKPTIFATVADKPVFGLPGHPLAAYFVFRLIVSPAVRSLMSMPQETPVRFGRLAVNLPSNHGREEYLCVRLDAAGAVHPLHTKSGVISVLSQADGYICVPRNAEGLTAGTTMEVYSL